MRVYKYVLRNKYPGAIDIYTAVYAQGDKHTIPPRDSNYQIDWLLDSITQFLVFEIYQILELQVFLRKQKADNRLVILRKTQNYIF